MDEIKEQIVYYLSKRRFLTLATITNKGTPLTHALAYVNIGNTIYFSTGKSTRKFKNIQKNPNVAYSIYEPTDYLEEVVSIQMEGKATPIMDKKESSEINKMLSHKFPFMANMTKDEDSIIIKVSPKACYFIDYTKGLGYREKVEY